MKKDKFEEFCNDPEFLLLKLELVCLFLIKKGLTDEYSEFVREFFQGEEE